MVSRPSTSFRVRICCLCLIGLAAVGVTRQLLGQVSAQERSALMALFEATGGSSWTQNDNWLQAPGTFNDPGTECSWFGVECDGADRVIRLSLEGNGLDGSIPPQIGQLGNLETLDLRNNQLQGEIPTEVGLLGQLQNLYLAANQLTGQIPPEIGGLASLRSLILTSNQLTGGIPPEIGQLNLLQGLLLLGNRLSGEIPPELGQLQQLRSLFLHGNQLSGPIPPEIAQLQQLRQLVLYTNQLSGRIPPELGQLTNLQSLQLNNNQLRGEIPAELAQLTNLRDDGGLQLGRNHLFTSDPGLREFLDSKHFPGVDWEASQTNVLYLPYYRGHRGGFTGFAISNYGDRPALSSFTAYGPLGILRARNAVLEGGTQLARQGYEIFEVPSSFELQGWVELSSAAGEVQGQTVAACFELGSFFQFGTDTLSQLDGSIAFEGQAKKLYFGRVFQGGTAFRGQPATTVVSLVNPNNIPIEVILTLHEESEGPLAVERDLPAKGWIHDSIAGIFGEGTEVSRGYVEVQVTEGPGAIGFEKIQLLDAETVIGLNASFGSERRTFFSAQFASQKNLFANWNLVNTSSEQRSVTLTAVSEGGDELFAPIARTLEPGEQLSEDGLESFGGAGGGNVQGRQNEFVGSLRIEADGGGVIGDVIFGDPVSFRFAAALSLQSETFTEAVFNQVAIVPGQFFTGLAFHYPGAGEAQFTVEIFSAQGESMGESARRLGAGERESILASELASGLEALAGGYIVIRSDQPLIAQMLFGAIDAQGISLFSAVPPTVTEPGAN